MSILNDEVISMIKQNKSITFSGSEGLIFLCGDMALKEFHSNGTGYFNQTISDSTDRSYISEQLRNICDRTNALRDKYFVKTPEMLDYYVKYDFPDIKTYLLMKKAEGIPAYTHNRRVVEYYMPDLKPMSPEGSVADAYSYYMAKKLCDADQGHFTKLVEDCLNINNDEKIAIDPWGQNIYYDDKRGFSILDLRVLADNVYTPERTQDSIVHNVCSTVFDYLTNITSHVNAEIKDNEKSFKFLSPVYEKTINGLNKSGISKDMVRSKYKDYYYVADYVERIK